MPNGNPAIYGRWRTADPTLDPNTAPTPTQTPGSATFVTNPNGTFGPDNIGVFAVHMALMHTGKVLMFSGHFEGSNLLHRSWSWDPTQAPNTAVGRWVAQGFPHDPPWTVVPGYAQDADSDLFCAHHVFLKDGRLLVVGGDTQTGHTNTSVHIYDPVMEEWTKLPDQMQFGRWYPTAVLLTDGSVLVFSGDSSSPGAGNIDRTVEHLQPPNFTPRTVLGGERQVAGAPRALQTYPSLHLVPGGKVFYTFASWQYPGGSGTTPAQRIASINAILGETSSFLMKDPGLWATPSVPEGQWQYYSNPPNQKLREEGTAVFLPPAQDGKILVVGGGWWDWNGTAQRGTPTSCEILNTQTNPPTWTNAGEMHHPRINVNTVLLPDGKVLIFGGHENYKRNHAGTHVANEAEIYDPAIVPTTANPSAPFTLVAVMNATRMYHATGILLPDATVLVAGGEENLHPTGGFGSNQRSMEIYEPPYCHQGPRPVIDGITNTGNGPDEINYGRAFTILTPNAAEIDLGPGGVILMRPGCTTHHTDSEQRLVHMSASVTTGGLRVQCPSDPNVAPPGYYMVFLVNQQGRPCERAPFVRLDHCVPAKGACTAPVFEASHWLVCLLLLLIAPLVIAAFIAGLIIVVILEIFVPGILAKYLCSFRKFLYRLKNCRKGNRDPCLTLKR